MKGASVGEGLGNKFLSHIKETTAIIHVVRCYENKKIIHVNNFINPLEDINIINTELLLSDIQQIKNILSKKNKKLYTKKEITLFEKLYNHLNEGYPIRNFSNIKEYKNIIQNLNLLTIKPVLYVANININTDDKDINKIKDISIKQNANFLKIPISESESLLNDKVGILNNLIKETYKLLNLITFFSVGKKEIKAWSIKKGTSILDAAKKIHTDIKRGFIRAEVISYHDFIKYKGENGVKKMGKCKIEGKHYIVKDGDIINFRFNV